MAQPHILVTTDFSPAAERAFGPVADIARRLGGKVTVLHIVHDLQIVPLGAPLAPPQSAPSVDAELQAAKGRMAQVVATFPKDIPVTGEVRNATDVVDAIVDYCTKHGVDWLAISTNGRTGLSRLVLGSVTEAIVRHSHVPVICFPRK